MSSKDGRKRDPRVIMGVCSAAGFLLAGAYKVYTFGWDDVPAYWVWAGPVFIAAMIGVGFWLHARERRGLKRAIARQQRAPLPGGEPRTEPPPSDP